MAIEKSLHLEESWVIPVSTLILHWTRGIEVTRRSYNLVSWTHLNLRTRFSPKILTWVLSLRSKSLLFYFCGIVALKIVTYNPFSGILSDQNWQKVLLVLICLDNQSHVSSTLPPSISLQRLNRYLFSWNRLFITKKHENCLLHWIWCPDWPNVAKILLVLNYLDIITRPSLKQYFWIRLSRCELVVTFLGETNFDCFPYFGLLINWTGKKVQLMFLVCRFPK